MIAGTLLLGALLTNGPGVPAALQPGGRTPAAAVCGAGTRRAGYVVGDLIEQRARVAAPPGHVLDPGSLPRPGTRNVWLALVRVRVHDQGGTPRRYEIELLYQLINAPTGPRSLALPGFQVRWTPAGAQGGGPPRPAVEAAIAQQAVRIVPILTGTVPMSAALIRPDRPPRPLARAPALLTGLTSAAGALAIGIALLAQPVLRRHNAPFARAHRRLARAVRQAGRGQTEAQAFPAALRILHRAFDQTAGWRLFSDRLDDFLAQRRQFADMRGAIESFLALSQREFFDLPTRSSRDGVQGDSRDLHWLLELTRECRRRERQAA